MRGVLAAAVLAAVLAASVGSGQGAATCSWRTVLDAPGAQLTGIAAVGDGDVWAVGTAGARGVILHWDGRTWRRAVTAVLPLDLAAVSARDVWVVGSSSSQPLLRRPRSARWDGRRWRLVPVPGGPGTYLRDVAGRSSGDAWAVGAAQSGPLLVRWDGRAWNAVAAGPRNGLLQAIDLPWAVGTQGETGPTSSEDPLAMRLLGGRWRAAATPHLDTVDENLLAVDAVSPGDVWAVGSADVLGGRAPLVLRLHGTVWRDESISGLPQAKAALLAVAAFGPDDAWAAGYRGFAPQQTLLAHWDGRSWTQVPGRPGSLSDLSALSAHDLWAVGSNGSSGFVERYACG